MDNRSSTQASKIQDNSSSDIDRITYTREQLLGLRNNATPLSNDIKNWLSGLGLYINIAFSAQAIQDITTQHQRGDSPRSANVGMSRK